MAVLIAQCGQLRLQFRALPYDDHSRSDIDMPTDIEISANDLRALAEAADGTRNTTLWIVPDAPSGGFKVVAGATRPAGALGLCIRTDDAGKKPALKLTSGLDLEIDPGSRARSLDDCDAIFTSISAIEKFVIPYYIRMRAPLQCQEIIDKFNKPGTLAALHLPDSVETTARLRGSAPSLFAVEQRNDVDAAAPIRFFASPIL
ncbi:MAG: hypothetical protein H7099_15875 [Gemmatimonadaceae bacterium]|nr:hypothetical protein [Gemmatimonadaceae bacterium]